MICAACFDLPTHSSSGFLYRYILPRMVPPPLMGPLARNPFFSMFVNNGDLVVGSGHGSDQSYTAQNEANIWTVGQYNSNQVKGKIIKLVSCDCGQELCQDLVQYGQAKASLGYSGDLLWLGSEDYNVHPWDSPYSKPVMLPIMYGISSLLDGATAGESLAIEKAGYLKNMEDADSELMFSLLYWNYDHAVLFGDSSARIKSKFDFGAPPFPPPPMIF